MSIENLTFSIIIPTYERPAQLKKCLDSVTRLDYPRDKFEVIVVDDGSLTPPKNLISSYTDKIDIKLLTQVNAGPADARNNGAKKAKGKFLAFTDDDCELCSNWLKAFDKEFRKNDNKLLGGLTLNKLIENPYSIASQELVIYLYSYYNADPNNAKFFTSNNIGVKSDLFRAIGGFEVTRLRATAEDRELCDRWVFEGNKMVYTPEAIVLHSHELSLTNYCKQHFNYGRGAYYFRQARAFRGQEKVKIEPFSFYKELIIHPFMRKEIKQKTLISVLLVLSQTVNVLGYYYQYILSSFKKS